MKQRKDLERTGNTLGKVKNPPKSEVDKYMQTHQSGKVREAQKPKPTYIDNVIHKANLVTRGIETRLDPSYKGKGKLRARAQQAMGKMDVWNQISHEMGKFQRPGIGGFIDRNVGKRAKRKAYRSMPRFKK